MKISCSLMSNYTTKQLQSSQDDNESEQWNANQRNTTESQKINPQIGADNLPQIAKNHQMKKDNLY